MGTLLAMSHRRNSRQLTCECEGERECRTCKRSLDMGLFYIRKGKTESAPHFHRLDCVDCVRDIQAAQRQEDPEKFRAYTRTYYANNTDRWVAHQLKKYGLTMEQFQELVDQQEGRCACCGDMPPEGDRLRVDHDHETLVVRGLLCHHCNTGLGQFRDDPQRLTAAIEYLKRASS